MASSVNPPRGMRDFLPAEKARREHVLTVIRSVFSFHGFDEIETPVVEDSARLHAGLGGDNEKLAFGVLKRGLTAGDLAAAKDSLDLTDLGLRFDLTVPLARFYATHRAELPAVFRSIQIAPVWRAERPQKGRFRQFVQCDIDIIGEAGLFAEIELLTATAATIDALGLTGWSVRVNDRRILTSLLDYSNVPTHLHERVLIAIDKLDKVGVGGVLDELVELGIETEGIAVVLRDSGDNPGGWYFGDDTPDWLDADAYDSLLSLREAVPSARFEFDPTLVRGMGYYTGTIFEIAHPASSSSLGGGGRYDGMIGRFLGADVPAAGFSIGFERILDLVEVPSDGNADAVALLYDPGVEPATLMELKAALIGEGRRVRLERAPRNVKPLLEQLAASGFSAVATVTSDVADVTQLHFRALREG